MWIRGEYKYESFSYSNFVRTTAPVVLEDDAMEGMTSPSVIPPTPATTKAQHIELAIRTKDIWLLRSLALSPNGLIHGTQMRFLGAFYMFRSIFYF